MLNILILKKFETVIWGRNDNKYLENKNIHFMWTWTKWDCDMLGLIFVELMYLGYVYTPWRCLISQTRGTRSVGRSGSPVGENQEQEEEVSEELSRET